MKIHFKYDKQIKGIAIGYSLVHLLTKAFKCSFEKKNGSDTALP